MKKGKVISTKEAPKAIGPFSQGVEFEGLIFISGQLPIDPNTGKMVEGDIKIQTKRVIENIMGILKAADSDLTCVLRCDVFLKDMNDFRDMNEEYASKFVTDPMPARQAFEVARLPLDARIEISCIASKG